MGCLVRVYHRGADGLPEALEPLEQAYGGIYDALTSSIVGPLPPGEWPEVSIHKGQLPFFSAIGTPVRRVMGLGSPGGGKTLGILKVAQVFSVAMPNSLGGIIAPTQDRLRICWRKFLELVEPLGWVSEVKLGEHEILLKNKTRIQFRAAHKQSAATGSPIAGHDWHWAVEDEQQHINNEALREVDARGRINAKYQVFSSATNEALHEFQMRIGEYDASPDKKVIRFSGPDNCFTSLEHWEALKRIWSPEDYDRIVNCLDVPIEGRVYPEFSYKESSLSPPLTADITAAVTQSRYQSPFSWVVGFDPGVIVSASVILKCHQGPGRDERLWVAYDEVTTRDKTSEWHGRDLGKWFRERGISLNEVLVLQDPHENKEADRSDLLIMKQAGFQCFRSNGGDKIDRRHRISMVNALLRDASQRRRLLLLKNEFGVPKANKLAESLGHLMYSANGEIEFHHKTAANLAHWSDALGYALFPFEHYRGGYNPGQVKIQNRWASKS